MLKSLNFKQHKFTYLMLLPGLAYLIVLQFYPVVESLRLSFTNLSLNIPGSGKYVGFKNYSYLLFHDHTFWPIFWNSFLWVFGSTVLQFAVAIPAAIVLNQKIRARGLLRGLLMVPWVTPVVAAGIAWRWIFNGDHGLLNQYLMDLHLIHAPALWMSNRVLVWVSLLTVSVWKGFPFAALMFLAGLQGIPQELYEAAWVDGANAFQRFIYVTLPSLLPVVFVTGIVTIITTWTKFEVIWALTNGGPGFDTSILPTYVYTKAFVFYQLGMGSAVATISAVFVLILMWVYMKLLGSKISWG